MNQNLEYSLEILQFVLDMGMYLVSSGAEIERVEDSIERMCFSYGAEKVEVFALTYMISVTISGNGYEGVTMTKRIKFFDRNMRRLTELNGLSRQICETQISIHEATKRLEEIINKKCYGLKKRMLIYAVISLSFSLFFGGNGYDCIISGLIGIVAAYFDVSLGRLELNRFFHIFLCSIFCGFLANLAGMTCISITPELISIGNIMIFIPGVIFTCSLQELCAGNMLSGITRLAETVLISLVIATGFALVNIIF